MGNDIAKLFGIEKEEKGLISILLIQSLFLGTFYGVFNITAHSLFLAKFDEILMARAYILSGLVGIALTYFYTVLQSRMRFHRFSVLNLFFVLLITISLWYIVSIYGSNWAIFALFIMMGPLNLLALLSFYGTTGRLFTLRQGRRLFGFVDTGIVIGAIISSFSIPALLRLGISTANIILISAVSILAVLFVQWIIGRRYHQVQGKTKSKEKSKGSMKIFREDSYIRSMGLFIAFSVVVAFFIQYSFMAVTRARYPLEEDLATFLGLFEGSMMIFTLLIKTFLFSYLIKNHGLKITLAVGPVLIGIFAIIVVIIGSIMGYQAESAGFMVFFLVLALARLFSKAMKDSVETPAFKVLYQTLIEKVRHNVQSAIDGTVNEIAALASGLLLTGLGALSFVKLIHFSWVLSILIALWVYTALKLYIEYRRSVRKSIDKEEEAEVIIDLSSVSASGNGFDLSNNYFNYIRAEEIIPQISNNVVQLNSVLTYAETHHNTDLLPLFKKLNEMDTDEAYAKRIKSTLENLENRFAKSKVSLDNISSEVEKVKDRKEYANAIFASGSSIVITDLLKLIRDKDIEIRREALYIIGRQRVVEMLPEVCDCLDLPQLSRDAYSVLKSFETEAFPALSKHYFRSSGNTYVRQLIIRLFALTGSSEAIDFLRPRLWAVHRDLRLEALDGLMNCNYSPDEEEKDKLIQEIQDVIGILTWNIGASISLKNNDDRLLNESLSEETVWWNNFLFGLLSLLYDKRSFDKIKSNLESSTVESVNLALEMIDIVVDDAIKPRLTALLDVVSDEDRLKSLFQFYPGEIPEYSDLVIGLINTDYNRIGVWTKACAIKSLYNLKDVKEPDFIIALLFSPNKILREESLRYLQVRFEDVYDYCSYRVPEKYRDHLAKIVKGELSPEGEIYNMINFLNGIFKEISKNKLIQLAMDIHLKSGVKEEQVAESNFVAWSVNEPEKSPLIEWLEIGLKVSDDTTSDFEEKEVYILQIEAIASIVFNSPAQSKYIVEYLESNLN